MDAITHYRNEAAAGRGQRRWPNEEFARFMGRNFFAVPQNKRASIRILELGCGTGGNLRLVADEGFEAWGVDLCGEYLDEAARFLMSRGLTAQLCRHDMTEVGALPVQFDAVAEVFSSFCLDDAGFDRMLSGVARILKPGGLFMGYTPARSTAHLRGALFPGDRFPWRFTDVRQYRAELEAKGFVVRQAGILRRPEGMEFVVVEATHGTPTAVM